jgi:predicted nucleotidyltransferase
MRPSRTSKRTVPLGPSPREHLLRATLQFAAAARRIQGVTRIALIGSLTTEKSHPKDVDMLVFVPDEADLVALAAAGRRLKGTAQQRNCGADIFIVNPAYEYRGRVCHWRDCRPGVRASCDARHCGERPHLHDDLDDITLEAMLIRDPSVELWPAIVRRCKVPQDVEDLLLRPLASSLLERDCSPSQDPGG